MTDVVMPQMGESIVEGTLTKWLKQPGERVERDEPLFEISTDKVDTEIPSPVAGTMGEILVQEGTTVGINTIVGRIDDGGRAATAAWPTDTAAAPPAAASRSRPRASTAPASASAASTYTGHGSRRPGTSALPRRGPRCPRRAHERDAPEDRGAHGLQQAHGGARDHGTQGRYDADLQNA